MRLKHFQKVSFLILAVFCAGTVSAKELGSKLEATAKKLTAAASAQGRGTATLAVFPFQADEKLSKKKVNFAVSEILTKNFLKLGKFTIIERAQLEEVMKEQKLGLSGAVDSKTAAEIGKLAGAKLLVLGNVIQMGNSYQLTAKLVDAETGEMIASEIIEVSVKTFDEDADRYLVLVPEYQTIGIYLALGSGFSSANILPPVNTQGYTITPLNPNSNLQYAGIGLRYFPSPKWMFDAAIMPAAQPSQFATFRTVPETYTYGTNISGIIAKLFIDRVGNSSSKLKTHFGVGVMDWELETPIGDKTGTILNTTLRTEEGDAAYLTPAVRLGLEWKPQARIGWAVFGQYNIVKEDYNTYAYQCGGTGTCTTIRVNQFTFPQVMIETTLSFYF